jgi:hypothetical protein
MNPFLLLYSSKVLYNFIYNRMKITNKTIYIHNRNRRVYTKGNKFYYIYKNNYKLVPSKMMSVFRGGTTNHDKAREAAKSARAAAAKATQVVTEITSAIEANKTFITLSGKTIDQWKNDNDAITTATAYDTASNTAINNNNVTTILADTATNAADSADAADDNAANQAAADANDVATNASKAVVTATDLKKKLEEAFAKFKPYLEVHGSVVQKFITGKNENIKFKKITAYYAKVYEHVEIKLNTVLSFFIEGITLLNKSKEKLIAIIEVYESETISRHDAMMILSNIKKVLFLNIFKNYFLEIIANNDTPKENIKDIVEVLSISDEESNTLAKKIEEINEKISSYENNTSHYQYKAYFEKKKKEISEEKYTQDPSDEIAKEEAKLMSLRKNPEAYYKYKKLLVNDVESSKNRDKIKEVTGDFLNIRKTEYWWDKIKSTIIRECDSITKDVAKSQYYDKEYTKIIKQFLTDMFKNSIAKEIQDTPISDTNKTNKVALEAIKTELEKAELEKAELNIKELKLKIDIYTGNGKKTYNDISTELEKLLELQTEQDTPQVQDEDIITKSELKQLTNSLIIILKLQIYDLHLQYINIIDTYEYKDKIQEDSDKFEAAIKA